MEASCSANIEWDVRELDVKEICLPKILEYLKNRCMKYFWALLYHDGSCQCEIIDETVPKCTYYHMFVWYEKKEIQRNTMRKAYFSNLPFMQYVRRIYATKGEICYPSVFEYDDVVPHLVSLIRSKH